MVRSSDTVARWGEAEFVVSLDNLGTDRDAATRIAMNTGNNIQHCLNRPYKLSDKELNFSVRISGTLFNGSETVERLMQQTDIALQHAKASGQARFYQPEMQAELEKGGVTLV